MQALSNTTIDLAQSLRGQGLSHRDIKKKLGISLGSAFKYTQKIILTREQHLKLKWRNIPKPTYEQLRAAGLKSTHKFEAKYSRDDLIHSIQKFFEDHKRIPTKREVTSHKPYARIFGSWNRAIQAAGFKPNPVKFARKHMAFDGHKCDSLAEFIIDNWLSERHIPHAIHIPYPKSNMTADFVINEIRIEFTGLEGQIRKYDQLLEKKRMLAKQYHFRLIEIKPRDVFPVNQLDKIFQRII